ncbi:YceI family protein [Paracoccus aerodenitrificans]|uniref:YceI family protein n=1 Tax=Paracoccus aerodenitrificans TaxID=3017781 RepID=UPI0022F0DC4B|nr:YceI family protein [Paracoccus aerodenitrificans]WBU64155.1 YceI family protein [Paracoccus aerodenitrificans]
MTVHFSTSIFGSVIAAALAFGVPAIAQEAGAPVMSKPGDDRNIPDAGTYVFDPGHSQIMFSYDHMGFSVSRGFVNGVEGTITLDPEDLASSTVEASFPLSSLRTVAADLDEHLMGEDFFNVTGEPPLVTFTSTSVELEDDNEEARVTGDLTLNGVTKPVTLNVEFNGAGLDPMTQAPTVGFSIEGEIRRSEFNLGAFVPAVDDEVELQISVEAKKEG